MLCITHFSITAIRAIKAKFPRRLTEKTEKIVAITFL